MSSIEIVLPGELLTLNPVSAAFAHGFGLFETLSLRKGCIELWEAHWKRLTGSALQLGINCPFDRAEVLAAVRKLAEQLPADGIIKLSLLKEGTSSRLVVYSRPGYSPPEETGLLMETSSRIDEASPLAGHKTHNYLENLLVLEAAREFGCYDGVRLNSKGHVAEGAVSNIFFFRDGRLHTPGLPSGLLPGVMRGELIEAFPVEQGSYTPSDLLSAGAVFLTNSSIGWLPVDWLLSEGKKIRLPSRDHDCFQRTQGLFQDRIAASAVRV